VINVEPIRQALAASVAAVDSQMSTWKPDSDLMQLNRADPGDWVTVPEPLMEVLDCALDIGRRSAAAFDIGVGDAVSAWGFGAEEANPKKIATSLTCGRALVCERLELDSQTRRVRKIDTVTLDLSGIAKGYAVDQMMAVLTRYDITDALVGLDGELAAKGQKPDGSPWIIALERPDYDTRSPLSVLELNNAAIATSGDYRHWVNVGDRRLSHTMDPQRGGPLVGSMTTLVTEA
jgi:thiamine biosynthesis lipoprotein